MNQEELYNLIKEQQPNICQIVAYKSGEKVYSDCWNEYNRKIAPISCQPPKVL